MKADHITPRFIEAYKLMAKQARLRPEAPSDGVGSVLLDPEQLEDEQILENEAQRYAANLKKCDDEAEFVLHGCTDFEHNRLFVYLLEATELCFMGHGSLPFIKRLLKLASSEVAHIEEGLRKRGIHPS